VLWWHWLASLHWIWWFRVRGGKWRIVSGVWDVGLTFTPVGGTVVYWCSFRSWTPYSTWELMLNDQLLTLNPNIGLLCWLEKSGTEDQGLLQKFEGSSGTQIQNDGGDWCWGLWAITGKKAQYLSRKICYSFSGWGICYLNLCLWNSNSG